MLFLAILLVVPALPTVHGLPATDISAATAAVPAGWINPIVTFSQGGNAVCVTGNIDIEITATTTKLLLSKPANQTVITEIIQEILQANSDISTRVNGGPVTTKGTFAIDATYCVPLAAPKNTSTTIQLLAHGIGLDKSYWDISPGFSYVDDAALAGYATVAYNRLGVGLSDTPDPLQVVQTAVDIEIHHGLIQLIRAGLVNGHTYKNVIGVGHSYGSLVQNAVNAKYPDDVDAAVLTGFEQLCLLGTH